MTDQQFRALVSECREAQRTYFRTLHREALTESKRLERLIDAELRDQNRPRLFPKED